MQPNNAIPELTKEELEVFLLIYAAHVDYYFSEHEKDFILQRTSKETFDKIYDLFLNRGDFASLKIILHYKNIFYQQQEEQDRLYNLLKEAFEVDGDYSRVEKVFVSFFKRMTNF
ncbi:MAG: hypothetical protein HKN09_12195 [Saprospiraceae bacterium]|nr:hypothetical protein [Gammaproteobacteria bacterium]NNE27595.1 hypothetical protein [Saprospiraceae bacterium]